MHAQAHSSPARRPALLFMCFSRGFSAEGVLAKTQLTQYSLLTPPKNTNKIAMTIAAVDAQQPPLTTFRHYPGHQNLHTHRQLPIFQYHSIKLSDYHYFLIGGPRKLSPIVTKSNT